MRHFITILPVVAALSTSAQNGVTWSMHWDTSNLLPYNETFYMEADRHGNVWVAPDYLEPGAPGGLFVYNGAFWSYLDTANSELHNQKMMAIHSDNQGYTWLASDDELGYGLERIRNGAWDYVDGGTTAWDFYLHGIASDSSQRIWLIGDGISTAYDRDTTWTVYDTGNSPLPDAALDCIMVDSDGIIWIGSRGYGLYRFDGTNWKIYTTANSAIPSNYPSSLVQDHTGTIWIGFWYEHGHRQVAAYDGDSTFVYHNNFGHPECYVNWDAMAVDRQGRVYAALAGCGLWRYDGLQWENITPPNLAVPLQTALRGCLVIDTEDRIWYSLYFDGIWVSDPVPMAVGAHQISNELRLTPNPTPGLLTIDHGSLATDRCRITITNALGQAVPLSDGSSSPLRIDLSDQPAGLYIITVTAGERWWKGKVVKM